MINYSAVVSRNTLLGALSLLRTVIERHHGLPVLNHVLLESDGAGMHMTCSNLQTEISTTIAVETHAPFRTTVPVVKLHDIVHSLPDGAELHFTVKGERFTLQHGKSRFVLQVLCPDDFPRVPSTPDAAALSMASGSLKRLLETVSHALASNDARYYLNGALLDSSSGSLRAVATDGHRLALNETGDRVSFSAEARPIIPRHAVMLLVRMLADDDQPARLELASNHLRVDAGKFSIITRLIDGRYPDYEKIIRRKSPVTIEVGRAALLGALRRVALLTDSKHDTVALHVDNNSLTVSSRTGEGESADETLAIQYQGSEFRIGFNVHYLIDAVDTLDTETVQIGFKGPDQAAVIVGGSVSPLLLVVMPCRLAEAALSTPTERAA